MRLRAAAVNRGASLIGRPPRPFFVAHLPETFRKVLPDARRLRVGLWSKGGPFQPALQPELTRVLRPTQNLPPLEAVSNPARGIVAGVLMVSVGFWLPVAFALYIWLT